MLKRETCRDGTVARVHIGCATFFRDAQKDFGNTQVGVST
jgi:hypothetical protein